MKLVALIAVSTLSTTLLMTGCGSSDSGSNGQNDSSNSQSSSSTVSSSASESSVALSSNASEASSTAVSSITSSETSSTTVSSSSGASSSAGTTPLNYTCTDSFSYGPSSSTIQSGTSGDILYDCKLMSPTYGFQLQVDSMTVVNLTKVLHMSGKVDGKSMNGTTTYNYQSGTVHIQGTAEGYGSFNCTETYRSPLPATVLKDDDSLEELMDNFGNGGKEDPTFISTTCPDNYYDEGIGGGTAVSVDVVMSTEYTVVDDGSQTHRVSIHQTIKM